MADGKNNRRPIWDYIDPENIFTGFPRSSIVCLPHLEARKDAAIEFFLCCSFRRCRMRAATLFCDCDRWVLHLTEIPVGR